MPEAVREVRLEGFLAEAYGARHRFVFSNARQALQGMESRAPGFRRALEVRDCGCEIRRGGRRREVSLLDATVPLSAGDFMVFYPDASGSLFGKLKKLARDLVRAAAFYAVGFFLAPAGGILGTIGTGLKYVGVGSGLASAAGFFAKAPDAGETDDESPLRSHSLSGPTNSSQEGSAVPIAFGRVRVGSVVVSSGVVNELKRAPPKPPPRPRTIKTRGGEQDRGTRGVKSGTRGGGGYSGYKPGSYGGGGGKSGSSGGGGYGGDRGTAPGGSKGGGI